MTNLNEKQSLKDLNWEGYLRYNGKKGIRNKILVIYTVECANFVATKIVNKIDDPEVEVIGFSGCTDNEYAIRLLISLIRHPNVGAVLVVGLGCEYIQPEWLSKIAQEEHKITNWFFIQQAGGTQKSIEKGIKIVRDMQKALVNTPKVTMYFSDLIVGSECGGSDYTSGLVGNVIVGYFYDWLIDLGGVAIFEEIVEAIGLIDILAKRGANIKAKKQIITTYKKALDYCHSVKQYSVSPGNFAGGLSTIEEKSMGAIIKSGSKPIQGVLKVGMNPYHSGLWLLDTTPDPYWMQFGITNPNDNEGLMALLSAGCHLLLFVTGRGSVVGSAVSPVIKITGNEHTFQKLYDDIDFNASKVFHGECSPDELLQELIILIAQIAQGIPSKSEKLGHKEYYIPYKYQNKNVILSDNCSS